MTRVVAAIDPGTRESALVVWNGRHIARVEFLPNDRLVALLRTGLSLQVLLAIEQVESYGMAVGRDVFETVWWAGRFAEAQLSRHGEVRMVPRRTVKLHL